LTSNGAHEVMDIFRGLAALITRLILGLLFIVVVVLESSNLKGSTEVFPLAGFVVFLSLASFSVSWARINPPISTMAELKRVTRAGLDFFIATGLVLASAGLLRIAQDALFSQTSIAMLFLVVHELILAAGLFIGWIAFSALLRQALGPLPDVKSEIAE